MIRHLGIQNLVGGLPTGISKALNQVSPEVNLTCKAEGSLWNDLFYYHYLENILNANTKIDIQEIWNDFDVQQYKGYDIVSSTCFCKGISHASKSASEDSNVNENMFNISSFILENLNPKVYVFENSPELVNKLGTKILERLYKLAEENGYTLLCYKTASMFHGLPQTRNRTFAIFFNKKVFGDFVPLFEDVFVPIPNYEDFMMDIHNRFNGSDDLMWNTQTTDFLPSESAVCQLIMHYENIDNYRDLVLELCNNKNQKNTFNQYFLYQKKYDIEKAYHDYHKLNPDMCERQKKEIEQLLRRKEKIESGIGGIWDHFYTIARERVGAVVVEAVWGSCHPFFDRFYNIREVAALMSMPDNYVLKDLENCNTLGKVRVAALALTQNVPPTVAEFIGKNIKRLLETKDYDKVSGSLVVQYNSEYKRKNSIEIRKGSIESSLDFE